ncbi:hypothetical protein FOZ63_007288, partial [Perkinsus olseni]
DVTIANQVEAAGIPGKIVASDTLRGRVSTASTTGRRIVQVAILPPLAQGVSASHEGLVSLYLCSQCTTRELILRRGLLQRGSICGREILPSHFELRITAVYRLVVQRDALALDHVLEVEGMEYQSGLSITDAVSAIIAERGSRTPTAAEALRTGSPIFTDSPVVSDRSAEAAFREGEECELLMVSKALQWTITTAASEVWDIFTDS